MSNEMTKRDTTMIEDKDRDSVSLDKEAQVTLHQVKPGMTAEDVEWLNSIPPREQARIYHKIDRRLVPMLALLYLIGKYEVEMEGTSASLTRYLRSEQRISTERTSATRKLRGWKRALEWLAQTTML
jgi:hypothetical protein